MIARPEGRSEIMRQMKKLGKGKDRGNRGDSWTRTTEKGAPPKDDQAELRKETVTHEDRKKRKGGGGGVG